MSLADSIDIYSPSALMAVMLSGTLFLLYSVINLIDMNGYIKNFNILDVGTSTRAMMIYAYISGYYMFLLKVVIALVTLFILTLIIRIAVSTIIDIFSNKKDQSGGAAEIHAGAIASAHLMSVEVVRSNLKYILGYITLNTFVILYLIIIPVFLFFGIFAYLKFYNQEHVQSENNNEAPRIMATHHNFLVYLIVSLFTITFLYSIYMWFIKSKEMSLG
jgi:hypothetical protein